MAVVARTRTEQDTDQLVVTPSRPARSARRLTVFIAGSLVLAICAGLVGSHISTPQQAASTAQPPPLVVITQPITYGVLRAEVPTRGTVTDANPVSLNVPSNLAGSLPVVTELPLAPGAILHNGELVLAVAERPVLVMQGSIPAFRTMSPGESGIDIRQLQLSLHQLGISTGGDPLGSYGSGTAGAVTAWYSKLAFATIDVPPDAATQLQSLQAAVTNAQAALARDKATATSPSSSSPSSLGDPAQTVQSDTATLAVAQSALAIGEATMGASVPLGEIVFVPSLPQSLVSLSVGLGSTASTSQPMGTIGSGKQVINAPVDANSVSAVHIGELATGHSDVSSESFTATVVAVATQPILDGTTGSNMFNVSLAPTGILPSDLVGQNVEVTIETGSTGTKTWIVPVAAITTDANNKSYITVQYRNRTQNVPVKPGLIAGGSEAVMPLGGEIESKARVVIGIKQ